MLFTDPLLEASVTGKINGRPAWSFNIMGRRATFTSTTAFNDVGECLSIGAGAAAFTEMTGAENLEVVSTSAQDNPAGTGIGAVIITGIDADGDMVTSSPIALNGLGAVAVSGKLLASQWIESYSAGGNNRVAAGDIILRTVGGAAHDQITAGGNKSLSAKFMVPRKHHAYINHWNGHAVSKSQDMRLRSPVFTHNRAIDSYGLYKFQDNMFLPQDQEGLAELPWLDFPPLSKIKVSTISSGAPSRCDASWSMLLIRDSY